MATARVDSGLKAKSSEGDQPQWDVVGLAVMSNRCEGIVRKMTQTMFRTSRSTVLNTAKDFSCCIVTRENQLLVMADSLPIHTMSGPDLMCEWMQRWHPTLQAGDAFLHNSPYHGNGHAGDHCILVPVVDEEGEHHATVIVKAHLADIGNSEPTTLFATARDVYHEGALIFPCVKVQRDYRDIDDIVRMCEARIRVPEVWYGDFLAMVGAARTGERELLEIGREHGWETFHRFTRDWFDYSEQRIAAAIRAMPRGRITKENAHDPVPLPGVQDGVVLRATVEVRTEDEIIEVDLRDNPDTLPCGINLTESTSTTGAMIGIFNSLDQSIPRNGGSARRLRVLLRENCCAGIPVHPASCSLATSGISERIGNLVQTAFSELGDGHGMAEAGPECSPATAHISGRDPRRNNAEFIDMMILGQSGGAGHPHGDGWMTNGELGDGGMMMRDSTEVLELTRPIRIWNDEILPDTEGAGRFRGAPSVYVEYGPADTRLEVMYAADGCVNPALGARGGLAGGNIMPFKRLVEGSLVELGAWEHVVLEPGETIVAIGSGGGGYGPPWERDPERVRKDVAEGWISRERAESVYGVRLTLDGEVDTERTERLRHLLAARPPYVAPPIGRRAPNELSPAARRLLEAGPGRKLPRDDAERL